MRPLDKGNCPTITDTSGIISNKTVAKYGDWKLDLIDRIGSYCAYCNMPLKHCLNVEHVVPKKPRKAPKGYIKGDIKAWENMLLACFKCNNAKLDEPINYEDYYFPEKHNTFLIFELDIDTTKCSAILKSKTGLNPQQTIKVSNTLGLFQFENIEDKRSDIVDLRWKFRYKAYLVVKSSYSAYIRHKASDNFDKKEDIEHIKLVAETTGFFQIWFDFFKNEPEVLAALIQIRGTATNCFDTTTFQPIPRNPSDANDNI
jgi:HNH endonuclease